MPLNFNNNSITSLNFNGNPVTALNYNGVEVWSSAPEPFYIKNRDNSNSITVTITKNASAPSVSLEYSLDKDTWAPLTIGTAITVPADGKIYYRAPQGITNLAFGKMSAKSHFINSSGPIDCGGDITTLLSKDGGITDLTGYSNYTFSDLFYNSGSQASNTLVDASKLILTPTTGLTNSCYYNLFNHQTNLIAGPQIPQIAVANQYTFGGTFTSCTSLTHLPANLFNIPVVDEYTYVNICLYCSSLEEVELFSTQTPPYRCYRSAFSNCSSLNSVKVHFTSFGDAEGTGNWLNNVAQSGTFYCPSALGNDSTISRGVDYCPTNWTLINI